MANQSLAGGSPPKTEKSVALAALLICVGLVVHLITLVRIHPLAFMAFILMSCPLVLAGVLLYLYAIVSHQPEARGR